MQLSSEPPDAPAGQRPPAACTIIARNYLSHARILARSYLEHEPGGRFYLLVVDGLPAGVRLDAGMRLIEPDELNLPYFYEMCFKYDVTELCTAVKPTLLSIVLEKYNEEVVIYFDPDILIMRPLDELKAALQCGDIVLIPHLLDPIPLDGKNPSEHEILIAGAYNLGFLALRKSDQARALLRWWEERLKDGCRIDPGQGLFVDQRWVDLVPSLFSSTVILRDETYDVAYWNIHSRALTVGQQFLVNGRPLAFFHFSGFDPTKISVLSKHQNRTEVAKGSALARLLKRYADLQLEHGYATCKQWAYGYSTFDNGMAVNPLLRELYLNLDPETRAKFGNPFHVNGSTSFLDWATRPRPDQGRLSPFLQALHRVRPDVAAVFPQVRGKDREGFLHWARTFGPREMGYDPRLARAEGAGPLDPERENGAGASPRQDREAGPPLRLGVNVCGYLRAEDGLGAVTRGYAGALRSLQVPLALRDLSALSPTRCEDRSLAGLDSEHAYDVNLVCVNADQHFVVMSHLGEAFFQDRYNIGVWFWELGRFPAEWHDRFQYYDEVWAASSFIAETLAPISPIPIVRVPPVVAGRTPGSRERGRQRLGVSPDELVYLFVFDFRSRFERKNPLALIEAFKAAFAPSDAARLIIKCVNEQVAPDAFEAMRTRAQGYPISIQTGYWAAEEIRDLMAACDAYVSLHRSEGLGLPMADAMALGKPVIATGWSGNTDFMTASNSFPVAYELAELTADVGPYRAGEVWAEPSVEHAAELMRFVFEHRAEAAARAEVGRQEIETNYSEARVASIIDQRLTAIAERGRVSRGAAARGEAAAAGRTGLAPSPQPAGLAKYRRTPVVPALPLDSSRYGWIGRLGKRAIARLLRHQTHYQQSVNFSFTAFMQELATVQDAQAERLSETAERLSETAERLSETAEQLDQLDARSQAIAQRLAARPYLGDDIFGASGDLSKPMGYSLDADGSAGSAARPRRFEDVFRGSEEFIAERQRVYLPFFEGLKTVVDLGSGRGEFLRLLAGAGVRAVGVELNRSLVQHCRAQGLEVVEGDAIEYLRGVAERSLDAIFSAQFIEHIEPSQLAELLALARSRLRAGGLFIAETVNPECHEALKTFHVDLSHQCPIYPQVLLFLCREAGFRRAQIFYPLGGGFTQRNYETAGEYAVVAVA